jgi:hypothetical protein
MTGGDPLVQLHKASLIVSELSGGLNRYFLQLVNNTDTALKFRFGDISTYTILEHNQQDFKGE